MIGRRAGEGCLRANGNMTGDENGKTLVYDAWNRLVDYKNGSTSLESYKFDALNRRIEENAGAARALFYTAEWQVIEERTSGVARVSYVWSPVYIDALIVRDRDADVNGSLEERLYAAHNANWNVSSIISTSAAVQERFIYDPFGTPSFKDGSYGSRSSSSFAWTVLHQGGRQSGQSGLYQFRNRELSAGLGVWNRVDPLEYHANVASLYQSVLNSPIGWVDPAGLQVPGKPVHGVIVGKPGELEERPIRDLPNPITVPIGYPFAGRKWGWGGDLPPFSGPGLMRVQELGVVPACRKFRGANRSGT
jgi:RHS repeat-associated protein